MQSIPRKTGHVYDELDAQIEKELPYLFENCL